MLEDVLIVGMLALGAGSMALVLWVLSRVKAWVRSRLRGRRRAGKTAADGG